MTAPVKSVEAWRAALREALREAMRARETHAVAALRETLAAIDNAEAVDAGAQPAAAGDGPIAGAVSGLGAAEVARKALTAEEVTAIVEREIRERRGGHVRGARPVRRRRDAGGPGRRAGRPALGRSSSRRGLARRGLVRAAGQSMVIPSRISAQAAGAARAARS